MTKTAVGTPDPDDSDADLIFKMDGAALARVISPQIRAELLRRGRNTIILGISDLPTSEESPAEDEPRKPHAVALNVVCSDCGLSWDAHMKVVHPDEKGQPLEPVVEPSECVRLLKAELAKRPYVTYTTGPNTTTGQTWSTTFNPGINP